MSRKAFHQLLKKYVDGRCSDAEKHLIDQWYQLLDDRSLMPVSEKEMDTIEERLWNKIHTSISIKNKYAHKNIYSIGLKVSIAAAVFVLIGVGIVYLMPSTPKKNFGETAAVQGLQQIKNETTAEKKITLEDGSIVALKPGAAIAFPKKFAADKREVFLEGVAFFKVSKNPERPFYVYDDNIITQVLGTSFYIKKVNQQIEVDVLTGRVAVFENNTGRHSNKTNGVVITPNQKVTYYANNHQFVTALVENPTPVAINSKENAKQPAINFSYNDAMVSQVLNDLRNEYKIDFIVENENINHCFFTGDITEQSLYNKLDLLCQAIQANYEVRGTSIVIDGKGCDQ